MPSIDYRQARSRITLQRVLELARFRPTRARGDELRGPCPIHDGEPRDSRSFAANPAKNAFRCFRCGAAGNQLDLWAAVSRLPLHEATIDLCRRLGEPLPLLAAPKPAQPDPRVARARLPPPPARNDP